MLTLNNLTFGYGETPLIQGLSHTFKENGVFAIMGPSGCGKTTLFRLICGLLSPLEGSVSYEGRGIAVAFQEPRLLPHKTVLENLTFVLKGKEKESKRIHEMLEKAGLLNERHKKPSALSGGMQSRVSLLRALLTDAPLVLLDEPFAALDEERKRTLAPLIQEKAKSATVLVITHSEEEAALLGAPVLRWDSTPLHTLA